MAVVVSPSRDKAETAAMDTPPRQSSSASRPDSDASSSSGDPASDRRDLDFFNQGVATRSEEYRLLFKLPNDEVLLQDFHCALQENILLQGHMYLFLRHVCFYSNILGFETKKTIPLNEITSVRKAKTAAIFPNAIEIVAGGKKHFFGSFLSRDEAYRLIVDGWVQHNPDAKAFLDRQDSKSSSSTEDIAQLNKDCKEEEEEPSDQTAENDGSVCKSFPNGLISTSSSNDEIKIVKTPLDSPELPENGNGASLVATNAFWEAEDTDAPAVPEFYTMIAETKFLAGVEEIFKLFFSDDSAGFLDDFHKKCGDKEFRVSSWTKHEQSGHVRNVSFLHPIKIYLGAKFGNTKEVQRLRVYRNNHVVIETSQTIGDAPFGDHFTVEGRWDLEEGSSGRNSCKLRVFLYVSFLKRTIFRGKIEQGTRDECRDVFCLWIKLAKETLNKKATVEQKRLAGSPDNTLETRTDTDQPEISTRETPLESTERNVDSLTTPDLKPNESTDNNNLRDKMQSSSSSAFPAVNILNEMWSSFISFTKTSRFRAILLAGFVAVILLMQVSIILLLTRSPKVYVINDGRHVGNTGSYSIESANHLERRLTLLKEEMRMVGSQMERMQYEYAWLKSHMESLEKLKDKL